MESLAPEFVDPSQKKVGFFGLLAAGLLPIRRLGFAADLLLIRQLGFAADLLLIRQPISAAPLLLIRQRSLAVGLLLLLGRPTGSTAGQVAVG